MTSTPDLPIRELFIRLGREPEDSITLGYYNDKQPWQNISVPLEVADATAKSLTDLGFNVYNAINVAPAFTGNRRGAEADVTRLAAVYTDLDFKSDGMKTPEACFEVIETLTAMLNCPPTAIVMSGHGLQPYWAIDEEDGLITDENRSQMAYRSRRFGALVTAVARVIGGKVDNVSDLPRVFRAPGTTNWKDPENPVPTGAEFPEGWHPLGVAELDEVLDMYGIEYAERTPLSTEVISRPDDWEPGSGDCVWTKQLVDMIDKATFEARHPSTVAYATRLWAAARNSCFTDESLTEAFKLLESKFDYALQRGPQPRKPAPNEFAQIVRWSKHRVSTLTDGELQVEINYHTHRPFLQAVPDLPKESGSGAVVTPIFGSAVRELLPIALPLDAFAFTDAANAERLANAAWGKYIQVPGLGWHTWAGGHYVYDEANSIREFAKAVALEFAEDPIMQSRAGHTWSTKSLMRAGISNAVALAESHPRMVIPVTRLNNAPYDLATPKGIVDLRSGQMRPADPLNDFNTVTTNLSPEDAPAPRWEAFLLQILGSKDVVDYMQLILGAALVGKPIYQVLPMLVGGGANGKSTLLAILKLILGGYLKTMPENFLLDTGNERHSTELADLQGVRIAVASETRPDGKFNEQRVKTLTGSDPIRARKLYRDAIEFDPSHSMLFALNHKPAVKAGGDSWWRRAKVIPFDYRIPDREQVENFHETLVEAEGAAIFHWMIQGTVRALTHPLVDPPAVVDASWEYRMEEDHMVSFLADTILEEEDGYVGARDLMLAYHRWCADSSVEQMPSNQFFRELKVRLRAQPITMNGTRMLKGIILTSQKTREGFVGPGARPGDGTAGDSGGHREAGLWAGPLPGV